jgi:hypothetical protein
VNLGALEVRTFRGRGLAAEFRFTDAVLSAPNLDALADLDRSKTLPASNLFQPGKGGPADAEKVAGGNGKGGSAATPTVSSTVRATETPSLTLPPAGGNGAIAGTHPPQDERRAQRRADHELADVAAEYVIAKGGRAWPHVRKRLRAWARAGCDLEELRERIDRGDHLPPVKW